MLYAGGVGFFQPTRMKPEASRRFASPYGSVVAAAQLITERQDNARLEGLGCGADRECAPCAAKKMAQANMNGRLRGLGEDLGTDEQAVEYAALAQGYLEVAIPRLQALAQRVEAIGPPRLGEGYVSESYYEQFLPILDETRAILEARPSGLDQETRETLATAATTVSNAVLRIQQQPDVDAWRFLGAVLTANVGDLTTLLVSRRATVMRIVGDAATGVDEEVIQPLKKKVGDALERGRKTLEGAGDVLKFAGLALGAVLLFALYGRVRG